MAARALVTLILCHSVVAVPHATRKLAEGEGYGDSDSDGDGYSLGEGRGGGYGTDRCSGPADSPREDHDSSARHGFEPHRTSANFFAYVIFLPMVLRFSFAFG
jgi:hypothetical protein